MPSPNSDEPSLTNSIEANKLFASKTVDSFVAERETVRTAISSTGNWLIASLLSVNSAGGIAAANFGRQSTSPMMFAFGIIFILLSAVVMHQNYFSLLNNIHSRILYLSTVEND